MHSYLPNAQINLWSNFNSEKLVKSETPLCCFAKVGLKAGENILQCHESSCASKFQMDIQIYEQISILRNCSKVKLCRAVSLGLGLKGVKIIAQNVAKLGVHDCLFNGHPNIWSSFHSKKYVKIETPLCIFAKFGLKGGENIPQHRENLCASLSIKWPSKSMSKFQFWETAQKWNSVVWFR